MVRAGVEAGYECAPNIALVKDRGVRDEALGLPFNGSLSVTLDRLRTRTRVRFDPSLPSDQFVLNGAPQSGNPLRSVTEFLDNVRAIARVETPAFVRSENNFQTASGLASSASGFAALAGAASRAAGLELPPPALSRLARLGSGSACRSLFGGFVEWRAGNSRRRAGLLRPTAVSPLPLALAGRPRGNHRRCPDEAGPFGRRDAAHGGDVPGVRAPPPGGPPADSAR